MDAVKHLVLSCRRELTRESINHALQSSKLMCACVPYNVSKTFSALVACLLRELCAAHVTLSRMEKWRISPAVL